MNRILSLFVVFLLSLSHVAQASSDNHVQLSLIPSTATAVPGTSFDLILKQTIAPHWHTYWKNPGESGFPIQITWDAPKGTEFSEFLWPVPKALDVAGVMNFVFEDEAHLITTVSVPSDFEGDTFTMKGRADWLVCEEICIPESADIVLELPVGGKNAPINQDVFEQAYKALPSIYMEDVVLVEDNGVASFILNKNPFDSTKNVQFFSHDWGLVKAGSMATISEKDDKIVFSFPRTDRALSELESLSGVLAQDGEGVEFIPQLLQTSQATEPPAPTDAVSTVTLLSAVIFALLGGMVLNLMPCVFPILSMKALTLVKVAEKKRSEAMKHGLAYTAGILVSFLGFAGVIIALKVSGVDIGWGFQLQNPIVVLLITWLLFAIGLNLLGVFDISGRFSGLGSNKVANSDGLMKDFMTGVLAVIVATPCTAPFMGVALGYALVQPAIITVIVFLALGLGLALPFLLLSILPFLQKIMPKPGAWMEGFKQFLAFPMFATCVWLVWVLDQQTGTNGVLAALVGILIVSFGVWIWKYQSKTISKIIVVALLIIGLLQASTLTKPKMNNVIEYTPSTLEETLDDGNPVFVNMTAAWCITCKVNERVIKSDAIQALFADHNVTYIEGDWTLMDDNITKYLTSFDRTGVPLYIYYPDGESSAEILPQILTTSILEKTIK